MNGKLRIDRLALLREREKGREKMLIGTSIQFDKANFLYMPTEWLEDNYIISYKLPLDCM